MTFECLTFLLVWYILLWNKMQDWKYCCGSFSSSIIHLGDDLDEMHFHLPLLQMMLAKFLQTHTHKTTSSYILRTIGRRGQLKIYYCNIPASKCIKKQQVSWAPLKSSQMFPPMFKPSEILFESPVADSDQVFRVYIVMHYDYRILRVMSFFTQGNPFDICMHFTSPVSPVVVL